MKLHFLKLLLGDALKCPKHIYIHNRNKNTSQLIEWFTVQIAYLHVLTCTHSAPSSSLS